MTSADHPRDHPRPPTRPPGLSLAEAARQLGLSREAVRSRVRRGQLQGVQTAAGWVVTLPGLDHPQTTLETTPDQEPDHSPDQAEAALVAQLRGENAYLREALARSQQGEAELRRLLAAEQQRRLTAPVEAVATRTESAENRPAPAEPATTVSTPWWRRWWR